MSLDYVVPFVASTAAAATPLILAASGELVTERSGVLNLGIEGMMLIGAIVGFAVTLHTGSIGLGFVMAILAGMAASAIFAFLVLTLQTNQVATGLSLTLFGVGLSAFIGTSYAGKTISALPHIHLPFLSDIPFIGPLLFQFDPLVYLSFILVFFISWVLAKTRLGLIIRAIGESPRNAHSIGYNVIAIRYGTTMFGGALAGLAGAYISMALTPMWAEGMTAGRGWIALAIVVFATWKPLGVLLGAYLFGGVTVLQLFSQGMGVPIPSEFLSMLPYIATVVVLVIISRNPRTILLNKPLSLGISFKASQ